MIKSHKFSLHTQIYTRSMSRYIVKINVSEKAKTNSSKINDQWSMLYKCIRLDYIKDLSTLKEYE